MNSDSTATVTSKGQITIPKDVRDRLDLKPGDRVRFEVEAEGTARMTALNRSLDDLIGILGPPPSGARLTVEDINAAIEAAAAGRVMRGLGKARTKGHEGARHKRPAPPSRRG